MTQRRHDENETEQEDLSTGGEVSSASSSFENAETSGGGADAVPDTPDDVAEDYT